MHISEPFIQNSIIQIKIRKRKMGLQNQLNDVSSESIPILLVALLANCVRYLRSLLCTILHSVGLSRSDLDEESHDHLLDAVGSGLAGLVFLAEQLNLNRVFSYPYNGNSDEGGDSSGSDCVVCLNRLSNGDHVRRLACRHVFHKECFDGWLDYLNFNCPLCRSSLVPERRVSVTERRVTDDLLTWFSLR